MSSSFSWTNPACPHLPAVTEPLPIIHTRKHREACGEAYSHACHELAHSLWRSGTPAQAILQIDKSFMVQKNSNIQNCYLSILWMLKHTPEGQFLGNPVRHFQHLASRMNKSQPNPELRTWRAWACLHLTEKIFHPSAKIHPRDSQQIAKEKLNIPTIDETLNKITQFSNIQESVLIENLFLSHIK